MTDYGIKPKPLVFDAGPVTFKVRVKRLLMEIADWVAYHIRVLFNTRWR